MTLQELIESMGFKTRSYSGRGMYGLSCLAVELQRDENPLRFCILLGEACHREELQTPRKILQDSMGLGSIVYFPSETYTEKVGEIDDETAESLRNDIAREDLLRGYPH